MDRHLITSALPYVNHIKHLGNLVGSLLPADVLARHLRLSGEQVLFVSGTDDHGAAIEIDAESRGLEPGAWSRELHASHTQVFERFGLSFDHFGATSASHHSAFTQNLYRRLQQRGWIDIRAVDQVFSPTDGRFLPDRYIVGTCPHCSSTTARGDQCDRCSRLLEPTDLVDARSAISGAKDLEVRPSQHAFFLLSKAHPALEAWYRQASPAWPNVARQTTEAWLARGLQDRCITRDLSWGIPVPDLPGKVFYVWFDAPLAYLSFTEQAAGSWQSWWNPDTAVTQFLGKDNIPFHTVLFPAVLIAAGLEGALPNRIQATHWLNYYGQRFSTRDRRGVFLDQALEALPADYWRYALLAQAPETADSSFNWTQFANTVNKDLVGAWANFVHRLTRFTECKLGPVRPQLHPPGNGALWSSIDSGITQLDQALRQSRHRDTIHQLRGLWSIANRYIDEAAPWSQIAVDTASAERTVATCFQLAEVLTLAARPVVPALAAQLLDRLNVDPDTEAVRAQPQRYAHPGRPFRLGPPPFARITDDDVARLETRFGGTDNTVAVRLAPSTGRNVLA